MKKTLFLSFFILYLVSGYNYSFGQCPDEPDVYLHSQAEVDSYIEEYPNCTELNNLYLEPDDDGSSCNINDISGFTNLQNLTGRLTIYYTDLTQLTGLNNLEHIYGGLDIYGNNSLESLLELQSLIDVQQFITIYDNTSLPECQAEGICNSLNNVETGFGGNQTGCNSVEEVQEQCESNDCSDFFANAEMTPSCYGECSGQITITAGGGTEPYYYDWGEGQTEDNSQSDLCPDDYSITVSDDAGCELLLEVTVTENPEIIVTISLNQEILCFGDCNGSLTANASGGTPPFSFSWNGGEATTQTISNLCAGTFTVTVTDDIGCTATAQYTLSQPNALSLSETHNNVSCNGNNDGSIDLSVSGGTPEYSYVWSNGASTQDISGLQAGTYTVTVTDDNGCTDILSVAISQPNAIVLTETHINVSCNGGSDGSIDLSVSGGTPDYSYAWSNGETSQDISNLSTNNYTVTVTDNNGCTATLSVFISQPDTIALTETHINVSCNGSSDGSIDLSVSGGTPDYSYEWSNGETSQDISDLQAGSYTVTVTDNNGCIKTLEVTITQPDALSLSETHNNVSCNGDNNGSIDLSVSGGTPDYSYAWSNGASTQDISGLQAGTYTVTVTDDNGCTDILSVNINEPNILLANATATDETGNDFEDGTATSAPSGGTSPYTYAWSNGETTQTITGLAPGNYTVTVTDAHSCTAEETVTVNEYICAVLTIEETQENVSCYGECNGILTVDDVTNGIPPYDYEWSTGETTQSIDNLCPGGYDVTVTDSKNCSVSESYTITEPDELSANASATDETANDAEDGTATANPSGGMTPYSYEWSTGETTQTIEDLAPGDYTVTVTDDNGCTSEETVIVNEFICPALSLESSQFDNTCYNECDGEITITDVINGVAPFTYEWSDGQTGQTEYELCAGDYDVTVTDSKNCSVVSETFTITEPEELTATTTTTGETYNDAEDGTATVYADGGTPPYSYLWDTGETAQTITDLAPGTYNVTVTDDNGCTVEAEAEVEEFICPVLTIFEETENVYCNGDCDGYISIYAIDNGVAPFEYLWNTGDTESSIDNLCPDTYSVTVTDADNCPVTKTYEITEPDELLPNATATDESSYQAQDGTAIANSTGGTSPYDYEWSTGATTQSISNLAPGDYIVTVTDYYNCQSIDTVTVNEFICPDLTVNATQTNINCYGACNGEIEVTSVTNAVEPLYYEWSNGGGGSYIDNLCSGDYTVTVTDAENCQVIQDFTITQPEELLANASATDETANDANDGTATANPTGGVSPYSYAWSNGESTQTISGLAPGSYTVTVTDNNGCTSIESVSVAEFGCLGLAIEISQTNVQCNSECNGILEVTGVTNGATPFTYTWSNGKTTAKIDSLCPGSYSVTVVDGNNCNVYGSYTITEPQPLSANATSTDETANDAKDGTAISNPSGGTQAYAYSWSTGNTTQAISGLSPGTYYLTVTDANGCTALDTVTIIEFTCPALEVNFQTSNISCFGACDGSIAVLSVNNAVSPLSYKWNTGATSSSLSDQCAGDYSVTITDAKNCQIVQNYTLTQPDEIIITVDSTRDVRLDPLGYIAITTNNNGNYIFSWTGPNGFSAESEDIFNLNDAGCYTFSVIDTLTNCSKDSTICLTDKTSTFDLEKQLKITIFPNPADNELYINFNSDYIEAKDIQINIFSSSGIKLKSDIRFCNKINTTEFNEGIYFIQLKTLKGFVFKKLVIVR